MKENIHPTTNKMHTTPTVLHFKLKGDACKYSDVIRLREIGALIIEVECQIRHGSPHYHIINIGKVQHALQSAANESDTLIVAGHGELIGLAVTAIPEFRAYVLLGCNTCRYGALLASKYSSSWVLSVGTLLRDEFAATIVEKHVEKHAPDNQRWQILDFARFCGVFQESLGWSITTSKTTPLVGPPQIVHCANGIDCFIYKDLIHKDPYTVLLHAPSKIGERVASASFLPSASSTVLLHAPSKIGERVVSAPFLSSASSTGMPKLPGPVVSYRCLGNAVECAVEDSDGGFTNVGDQDEADQLCVAISQEEQENREEAFRAEHDEVAQASASFHSQGGWEQSLPNRGIQLSTQPSYQLPNSRTSDSSLEDFSDRLNNGSLESGGFRVTRTTGSPAGADCPMTALEKLAREQDRGGDRRRGSFGRRDDGTRGGGGRWY
jgi:hypothetical protein